MGTHSGYVFCCFTICRFHEKRTINVYHLHIFCVGKEVHLGLLHFFSIKTCNSYLLREILIDLLAYFLFLIDVYLIYDAMLVSDVQQNDPDICAFFLVFFSIVVYYKILNIIPYAIQ